MCIFDKQPLTWVLSFECYKVTLTVENNMYILHFDYNFITGFYITRCPGQPFVPVGQPKVDPWLPDRATKIVDLRLCNYDVGQPNLIAGCPTGQPVSKSNVKPCIIKAITYR